MPSSSRLGPLVLLVGAAAAGFRIVRHYRFDGWPDAIPIAAITVVLALFAWRAVAGALARRGSRRTRFVDLVLVAGVLALVGVGRGHHVALVVAQAVATARAWLTWPEFSRPADAVGRRPSVLIVVTFGALILLGWALLASPVMTVGGTGTRALDALFTATSAVCVTGLIVVDTATHWSPLGQTVILVLIQVGGLGIMTLWAGILILVGGRMGFREEAALSGVWEPESLGVLRRLIRHVVVWTLVTEAIGAVCLWGVLSRYAPPVEALWSAVFHAISAFCNAGFSLYSDSLRAFAGDPGVSIVMMALIVAGGLGFPVLDELGERVRARAHGRRTRRLSFHARLTLTVSAVLVVAGAAVVYFLEFDHALAELSPGAKVLAATFQSVTARTAGFETLPTERLGPAALLVVIALMFVGAGPASTGGGVKVTTLGVLVLTVRSYLHERPEVEAFGRRVSGMIVQKVIALTLLAVALALVSLVVLARTESAPFLGLFFETISAIGTVGLSTGVTGTLTDPGRVLIIALMFLGRVGPLTLVLAVGARARSVRFQYPEGHVIVG